MSAIAKPLVNFTNALNPNTYVPVDHVITAEVSDISALPNTPGSSAVYYIIFNVVYPNSATKEIKIEFATSGARNTSFANFKTLASAAIA